MSNIDRLQDLFLKQQYFQAALNKDLGKILISGRENISTEQLQQITKETVLQLFSEVNEVLNEINWKNHKREFPIEEDKIKEEIIDVFIFILNLAFVWGMTPDEFYNQTIKKINKNFERFVNK